MSRPHVVSPAELSALRDLELVSRTIVEGLRQGLHRSPFHGYNAEFNQYRHYRPGDDLRYVDWKAFARSNRLYTRQFRESTNLSCLFVIDVSRSMDYPTAGEVRGGALATKFGLAQAVTAILGTLVLDQGDAAGVLAVGDRVHLTPARSGHHHLRVFLSQVATLRPAGTVGIAAALGRAATAFKRRGLIVVVSDLYEEQDTLPAVKRLARMGHDVVVIQTLAREELTLDVGDAVELVDLESDRRLVVQTSQERRAYTAAIQVWADDIERQLTREGLQYLRLVTGAPLEPALRRFLLSRRSA